MSLEAFTKPPFMICEGEADKGFLERLIEERGLPDFQICHAAECNKHRVGGKTGFQKSLEGLEPISGFASVRGFLVVGDNDDMVRSFADIQQAVTGAGRKAVGGYSAPNTPAEAGRLAGKPIAILMVPDPVTQGDLETLCLPEIFRKWPNASGCVHEFLRCTGAIQWQKQSSIHKAFARSATVGFNEDDPYKGIGQLFKNGTLSTLNTCFDHVAQFLRNFDVMCGI